MAAHALRPVHTDGVPRVHAMSVDVEEHFQVSAMEPAVARADWDRHPSRVAANTRRTLDLFERHGVKATFFTLGWVAKRQPALVRDIVARGHELASHGMGHQRVHTLSAGAFRADVRDSKALLEDISGAPVRGYRAPSFSIDARTPWAHEVLRDCGYRYSSSVFPLKTDHYGMPEAPRFVFRPFDDDGFLEIPPTTAEIGMPSAMLLAMVIRSGSTPLCSMANILPVRPKPLCTSSAIIRMSFSSQILRISFRKLVGAA